MTERWPPSNGCGFAGPIHANTGFFTSRMVSQSIFGFRSTATASSASRAPLRSAVSSGAPSA